MMRPSWAGTTEHIRGEGEEAFIDGSGCGNNPRLRRCGWGVAWLRKQGNDDHHGVEGGIYGNIGDEKRTVAKSELEALVRLLDIANLEQGTLKVWCDNEYVDNTASDLKQRFDIKGTLKKPIAHADRWKVVWEKTKGTSEGNFEICWAKAHMTEEDQLSLKIPARISIVVFLR
jgi:hypothetical protein